MQGVRSCLVVLAQGLEGDVRGGRKVEGVSDRIGSHAD